VIRIFKKINKMDHELKKYIRKTGTTTIGIVCKDGVLLAGDRKGTYATDSGVIYIAAKDEQKVEQVNDNVIVTVAGVASDLQKVIKIVRSELKLKELKSKKKPSIKEAANLFATIAYQNIRQFSAIPGITHFLLAGYDDKGVYLYDIHPDGYIKKMERYSATGSGMMHVNPILDSEYTSDITLKQGIELAKKAVSASSNRDPGSGEGIDVFTITKEGIKQVLSQEAVIELKNIE
jgi:proteasome beta subunit